MTKTGNTNTGTRAVLGGVFGTFAAGPSTRMSLAAVPGFVPAR